MNDKIKPSDLAKQAEELHQQGKMPPLEDVLAAVAGAREKYADKILEARKQRHPADTLKTRSRQVPKLRS